jgi:hypothetical protein
MGKDIDLQLQQVPNNMTEMNRKTADLKSSPAPERPGQAIPGRWPSKKRPKNSNFRRGRKFHILLLVSRLCWLYFGEL